MSGCEGHAVVAECDTIVTPKSSTSHSPQTTSRDSHNARYHHPHPELQKGTDLSPEAEQTELSSPPFDGISSLRFSPFNSAHLLVSSWDAVSSLYRRADKTSN
jgi:hypothetical protein